MLIIAIVKVSNEIFRLMFLISLAIIALVGEFTPFSFISLFMIYVVLKVFLVIIKGLFKRQNLY